MTTGRQADNIRAIIRSPRTTQMLFKASQMYDSPYNSINHVRFDLLELYKRGFVKRQEIPSTGRGQKEFVYAPAPKAKFFVPELESIHYRHPIYRGITESSPWHSIATSDFLSDVERSIGELGDRMEILGVLRPREFEAKVTVKTRRGEDRTKLIPDYTFVVSIDGKPRLFFVEIQIQTPVIIPISHSSISRSFQYKLTRYKVFSSIFRNHSVIKSWEESLDCKFDGFQVLVVTTRGNQHLQNLIKANRNLQYNKMFLFTRTEMIEGNNVFSQPIWTLASGDLYSILK